MYSTSYISATEKKARERQTESKFKVTDRQVEFVLKKITNGWWPRLTATPQKPAWLKIDFDRWKMEEDVEDEEPRDVMGDYPDLYEKLEKEELGYRKEDLKKVYLIFYNLCQFVGFTYVLTVMTIRYFRDGPDSMEGTYEAVGGAIKFCQLMQFLEVMHPLFGYTKGQVLTSLLQTCGRAFVLFCMIEAEPRMWTKPVIFYLFFIWSLIEFVRYPFYISQLLKMDSGLLVWLRYTMWIPLYPLGFLCEGVVMLSGESGDVNEQTIAKWVEKLSTIIEGYESKNTANGDETGLFFQTVPSKTLCLKGEKCSGGKFCKERLTVFLCGFMTGEMEKPLVIGKTSKPRCFKNVDVKKLPVEWRSNKRVWMTSEIMEEWLQAFNARMKQQNRHVLLFLDNTTCHLHIQLSDVCLAWFPPNITSVSQPMDQRVINCVKVNYRKLLMRSLLSNMEKCASASQLTKLNSVLDAII
ncbi:hypothetical protein ANN_15365 [Periplaneta americana]|uniref:Very-long-chain (3R)-3-hydroxyacyl-CoA dehydratase n=1 Tax=Periplaneta americana TaxID=6978 RepID=A0ABQ8SG80_PERAM|nr:hypothetical protein ANN_15365 [Periplaneta americana]